MPRMTRKGRPICTSITSGGDIILTVGGQIGDVNSHNPVEVDAAGEVHVAYIGGDLYNSHIWAFLRGHSGDDAIHYNGSIPPGIIWWNGMIWGGREKGLVRADRADGAFNKEIKDLIARYTSQVWNFGFLYFPHVHAYLDMTMEPQPIEYIIDGRGLIEGLPEGVEPSVIDFNSIDDTYTWN